MNFIGSNRERAVDKILDATLLPVRELLPAHAIEQCCRRLNYEWRDRVFNPAATLLVCIWKHFQPALVSVRAAEDFASSLLGLAGPPRARDGKDFCVARARLPEAVFQWAAEHVGGLAQQASAHVYHGLRVVMADGTTLRTPNTDALDECFGRSRNAARKSRSPLIRLVLLVCAGCSAVLHVKMGPYATSEQALFLGLLAQFRPGQLLLADRGYASFVLLNLVRQREAHFGVRVSERMLKTSMRVLGYRDDLRVWKRPAPSQTAFAEWLEGLPESMTVRVIERVIRRAGYRTWTLRIATSLLDPAAYPAETR